MVSSAEKIGQIVRVYAQDRFTIWCLDDQRAYSCYSPLDGLTSVGELVRFSLTPDGQAAERPRAATRDALSPEQEKFLVLRSDDFFEPEGKGASGSLSA
jgi:hypothetical protein